MQSEQAAELEILLRQHDKLATRERAQSGFIEYVQEIWPDFISGSHHRRIAKIFDRVVAGDLKRVIINLPPRFTKSEFASKYLPSYFLGKYPDSKIIQCGNTTELAVRFGRQVRNLVDSEEYQAIFPGVGLRPDSKAAGRWNTSHHGEYFAVGVGGALAGRGADLLIIDDPHSEQESISASLQAFESVYEWYTLGPRQRLQPGAAIIIVMTRWHKSDLTGKIVKNQKKDGDDWEVVTLPAIKEDGESQWPEYWSAEELLKTKVDLNSLPKWNATYMQNPSSQEVAIVKRDWWKVWDKDKPPQNIEFVMGSYDTAYRKEQTSDPSSCIMWGVFEAEDKNGTKKKNLIMLNAWEERLEFPDLKRKVRHDWDQWDADLMLVEAKSAGWPLIQELRTMGIAMEDYTPSSGSRAAPNDKVSRLNMVTEMFKDGLVWRPNKVWAEEVVEQIVEFPRGDQDGYVDCTSQALRKFRDGGWIATSTDDSWFLKEQPRKKYVYYN